MFHKGQNLSKAFVLYSHLYSLYGHLLPLRSYALYSLLPSTALYLSTAFYPLPPLNGPLSLCGPVTSTTRCLPLGPVPSVLPLQPSTPLWPSTLSMALCHLFLLYGPLSPLWPFIPSTALYNPLSPLREMFFLTVL